MAKGTTRKKTVETVEEPAEEKEKTIGLFDVLNMIEGQKTPWNRLDDGYKKAYSQFMINRFVSSQPLYCPIVAELSCQQLTDEQHYLILCNVVTGNRKHWFNYKAYKKEKVEKDLDELIFACCKEYEIGHREAKMYINNLEETVKDQLRAKWAESYNYERGNK